MLNSNSVGFILSDKLQSKQSFYSFSTNQKNMVNNLDLLADIDYCTTKNISSSTPNFYMPLADKVSKLYLTDENIRNVDLHLDCFRNLCIFASLWIVKAQQTGFNSMIDTSQNMIELMDNLSSISAYINNEFEKYIQDKEINLAKEIRHKMLQRSVFAWLLGELETVVGVLLMPATFGLGTLVGGYLIADGVLKMTGSIGASQSLNGLSLQQLNNQDQSIWFSLMNGGLLGLVPDGKVKDALSAIMMLAGVFATFGIGGIVFYLCVLDVGCRISGMILDAIYNGQGNNKDSLGLKIGEHLHIGLAGIIGVVKELIKDKYDKRENSGVDLGVDIAENILEMVVFLMVGIKAYQKIRFEFYTEGSSVNMKWQQQLVRVGYATQVNFPQQLDMAIKNFYYGSINNSIAKDNLATWNLTEQIKLLVATNSRESNSIQYVNEKFGDIIKQFVKENNSFMQEINAIFNKTLRSKMAN